MANFTLNYNHWSGGLRSPGLSSADTRRRCKMMICVPWSSGTERRVVKAMMGKYKGTQMREKQLTEMIEKKVMEAKEVCGQDESTDECKVAWDEVEEVSQAKADLRLKLDLLQQDPLESFCQDNPETDECRVYED